MRRAGPPGAVRATLVLLLTLTGLASPTPAWPAAHGRPTSAHTPALHQAPAHAPPARVPPARALAPAPFNPLAGNEGFPVFANTRAEFNNTAEFLGPVAVGGDLNMGPTNVAYRAAATASSAVSGRPATNVTDLDPETFWQAATVGLPQTLTVDLGASMTVAVLELKQPLSLPAHTLTLSVQTSTDGSTFTTGVDSATYTFNTGSTPTNAAVITVAPTVTGRYVRLDITASTGLAAVQVGMVQVFSYRTTSDRTANIAWQTGSFNPNNEKEATSLVVGGGINWSFNGSGSYLRVISGYAKIGNMAGTNQVGTDKLQLQPAGNTGSVATPQIYGSGKQTSPINQGGLIDFAAAFSTFRTRAAELAACPANLQLTDDSGTVLPPTIPPGTNAKVTPVSGRQNMVTISAANLRNIANLTFQPVPTATSPVIITVDTAGVGNAFTWEMPNINGLTASDAQYILLNFPTATAVTVNGSKNLFGTIYAPRASVTLRVNILNGAVVANEYVQGGPTTETTGDYANQQFATTVTSCATQALTISKSASVTSTVPGGAVSYTITVMNDGTSQVLGATLTDSLADVVDDATYQNDAATTFGAVSYAAPTLTWTGNLQPGGSATITYSVVVKTPRSGNGRLINGVSSPTPGATCPTPSAAPACRTAVTVAGLTISKAASPASAAPGSAVSYTVTVTNSGQTPLTGATFTDALGAVLDDATYGYNASATIGTVSYASPNLTWTGDLAVGDTSTITYSVTVNSPRTGDGRLTNSITSTTPANNCPSGGTDARCTTTVTVPHLAITKVASVATVTPGGTVGYTVTLRNTGQTALTGATFTDSLAGVLDDASYGGDATATTGTVNYTAPNLTWTGNLGIGNTVTVTYSVAARSPAAGDRLITNAITSTTPGSDCPAAAPAPTCATTVTVLVPGLTIVKTADAATTSIGRTVKYTTTVTNSGQTPYTGVVVRDSLGGVLDDATYNNDAGASAGGPPTLAGTTLTWVGDLAVGAKVTISYSVTTTAAGDRQLVNVVTSDAVGSNCPTGGTDTRCRVVLPVLVPGLTVTHVADPTTAAPGDTVSYTITILNSGQLPSGTLTVTEALTDILDDATYGGGAVATAGTVDITGTTLTWTGGLLPGDRAIVRYTVTVTGAGNHLLSGVVLADASGSNCAAQSTDPRCATTVAVSGLHIDFKALTVDGSTVVTTTTPGSKIRFDLTLTNTGQVPYDDIVVTNDASHAFDDIVNDGNQTASSGELVIIGNGIKWTGDIPVGGSVFITGTTTVKAAADLGDRLITGTTISDAPGSDCPTGTTAAHCQIAIRVLVPALSLTKAASVSTVVAGGTVTYTVTATNSGDVPYTAVRVDDLLDDVVDDATYNGNAVAVIEPPAPSGTITFSNATLTWVGDLAVGSRMTMQYTVTVGNPPAGDRRLTNSVLSTAPGSTCATVRAPNCTVSVTVLMPRLTMGLVADVTSATPGAVVSYTLTITNDGQVDYPDTPVSTDLTGVLDDAVYQDDATATGGGTLTYAAPGLTWRGDVAVGATVTVRFTARVDNPALGDRSLVAVVRSAAVNNSCPAGSTNPACTVAVPVVNVQTLTITKTTEGGILVAAPGQVVRYVVTMHNSAPTTFVGATFTDDLAGVTDDAAYNGDATFRSTRDTVGQLAFNPADSTITWSGDIPAQASITVTYSVTVHAVGTPGGDHLMTNTVVSTTPGTNCPAGAGDARCTYLVRVAELITTVGVTPATAAPGDTVTFTATIANGGQYDYHDITVSFSTTDLYDDAFAVGNATASSGTLTSTTDALIWRGDLPAGPGTVTITSSVRVRDPATGNKAMLSTATTPAIGANCPAGSTDPACEARSTVLVTELTIVKSAPTAPLTPGATVPYTLTLTNSGDTAYTGIDVVDNLGGALDDATAQPAQIVSGGGTLTFAAPTLTWTGDLAVGAVVTIRYDLTVKTPDPGDKNLVNTVTSTAQGSTCPSGTARTTCRVSIIVLTPALTLRSNADVVTTTVNSVVTVTVTISNTGQTAYSSAVVSNSLTDAIDDATYNGDATADVGTVALVGDALQWTGTAFGTGAVAHVTYSMTVDRAGGNKVLVNTLSSTAAGTNCPVGNTDPVCLSRVAIAVLDITHVADPALTYPTGVVVYRLVISNAGAVPYRDLTVDQDLSDVLDDATANGDAIARGAAATAGDIRMLGPTLSWFGDLQPGGVVTVDQSFTVNYPITGDRTMTAVATSAAIGSSCVSGIVAAQCIARSAVQLPELTVTSSADPLAVTPGGAVSVTLTATNTGAVTYTGAGGSLGVRLTESLAGALDDATYNNDAKATGVAGQLSALVGTDLTWSPTGDMAPGQSVTITYSLTAKTIVTGDRSISRRVTADALGAQCPSGDTSQVCRSVVPVLIPGLTITKTADTQTAAPSQTVSYTLTITNTGQAPYPSDTSVTDDLTGVIDDATYRNDATADRGAVSYTSPILTWTGPLPVDATATVHYSVRVEYRAAQQELTNKVTSTAIGANCAPGSAELNCTSTVTVLRPELTIDKTADLTNVVVGGTVRYSIVLANTGEAPYTSATVIDTLADVIDAADYQDNASATAGSVEYTAPRLTWTGDLPVGATVVISYSVIATGGGDNVLTNDVYSTEYGNNCPPTRATPGCVTTTTVEAATITLTGLTDAVTLGGPAMTTATVNGAITGTVTTNSPTGYTVGVTATSPELSPITPDNPDLIPVADLGVRRTGDATFAPLSADSPVLVQIKPGPSGVGGDPLSSDLSIKVPLVRPDRYTVTLEYVAVTQ